MSKSRDSGYPPAGTAHREDIRKRDRAAFIVPLTVGALNERLSVMDLAKFIVVRQLAGEIREGRLVGAFALFLDLEDGAFDQGQRRNFRKSDPSGRQLAGAR